MICTVMHGPLASHDLLLQLVWCECISVLTYFRYKEHQSTADNNYTSNEHHYAGELGHVRLVRIGIGIQISDPSDPSESTGHIFLGS